MSTTDEIKSRIDIVELITASGVRLRKSGRNYTGFCPFHPNKHTPAFVVWPETGTWRCFGECNEGGDIFKFVMKKEGIDFREALTRLAAQAGVVLPAYQAEAPEQREAYEHVRKLLEDARVYYAEQLRQNPTVLAYLREKRGLTDSTIETFGLGYAPPGYDHVLKHFRQRGYSEQEMLDAGLLSERQADSQVGSAGSTFDRFRNRIMIPIRDENGRMSGFGARIVDPDDVPKFLNSPETPVFTKGHLLFGLDRARKPIRAADQAVIVEGYLDVIALHQAGYENVVSPMGTALTDDQLRLLKRFTRKIVLALDPDTAGQKAVLRGLEAARQAMDREGELGFDARGLLRNEARLQADLRVASMPDGLDPDEIVQRDPKEWKRLIEAAQPIIEHVMQALAQGRDLRDRKVAAEISDQVLPLIQDLPRAEEREFYTQKLARFLRIDERAFMGSQRGGRTGGTTRRRPGRLAVERPALPPQTPMASRRKIELHVLGWLFQRPELIFRVDRLLQENGLEMLAVDDFAYTDEQLLFGLIRQSVEQDEVDQHAFVVQSLPEALDGLKRELLTMTETTDVTDDRLIEEVLRGIRRLREEAATEKRTQYRFLQEEAQESGDTDAASQYLDEVLKLTQLKRALDQFERKMSVSRMH
ncbi:MAG TPA: DNA primase [Anaerolineales bacterium]|nr:DNA primase [Anaerolineales bacterium]